MVRFRSDDSNIYQPIGLEPDKHRIAVQRSGAPGKIHVGIQVNTARMKQDMDAHVVRNKCPELSLVALFQKRTFLELLFKREIGLIPFNDLIARHLVLP